MFISDIGVAESCDSALRHYEYAANHVVEQIVSTYILYTTLYHILCTMSIYILLILVYTLHRIYIPIPSPHNSDPYL